MEQPYKNYITFADPEVFRVLKANGVSTDGKGITYADVKRYTRFDKNWFYNNNVITSFDEFQYFTNLNGSNWQLNGSSTFYGCKKLTSLIVPPSIPLFGMYCFQLCGNGTTEGFTLKILRTAGVVTYGTNALRYAKINKILVPSALVESYKAASGWSSFTDKIEGF